MVARVDFGTRAFASGKLFDCHEPYRMYLTKLIGLLATIGKDILLWISSPTFKS